MQKRWYDTDSTMSLAISMLKNATEDKQNSVCKLIEKKAKELNINNTEKPILFKVFDKRWYDEKENVYNAMEIIRCSSVENKRILALAIIDHLCNLV